MVVRPGGELDRFELRDELGVGASGTVYRVLDRSRGEEVALKALRKLSGADLYRFKREFRALVGVEHPNLVALHELFAVDDEWMFTMELVAGERFDRWVRPAAPLMIEDHGDATVMTPRPGPSTGVLDEARLRAALVQLADAVTALHAAGWVHRDVKPSNVLVEPGGRAVLLDFGLVIDPHVVDRTHEGSSVGTVAYMSPEQAADLPVGPATDWYAVGVMLYEALAGHRPIRGPAHEVMLRKQLEDPPHPGSVTAGVPPDLDRLCMRLLDRDPRRRPDGPAVLAALGASPSPATLAVRTAAAADPHVGDDAALVRLREAYAASRDHLTIVAIAGADEPTRRALLGAFLTEVRREHDALVLASQVSARDQTRMPGLDQALDQLSAHVMGLPRPEIEALMGDAVALARIFPALRRLPGLQIPNLPQARPLVPEEIFAQGVAALRRVLSRLAARRPVVLAVDGTRGATAGSPEARIVSDHFAGPDPPRMLVVVTLAQDVGDDNPTVLDVRRWRDEHGGDLRWLELG